MKKISLMTSLKTTALLAAITFTFSGCSSYHHSNTHNSPIHQKQTNLGAVLTDKAGMTLYTFKKDKYNVSNCNKGCAVKWPPLLAKNGAKGSGKFSIITRANNTKQWAVNGKPLYRWFKDKKAGDTTGQGIKSVWYAAKP